jgi:hypothetical protein
MEELKEKGTPMMKPGEARVSTDTGVFVSHLVERGMDLKDVAIVTSDDPRESTSLVPDMALQRASVLSL